MSEPAGDPAARPRRILVVDDQAINRDIIGTFLRHAGYVVSVATSGVEAVGLAAGQDFDLILMDVRMAGMDGLETTRQIRANEHAREGNEHGAIYGLTFYDSAEDVAACLAAGMDGAIQKLCEYPTLIAAVEAISLSRKNTRGCKA